MGRLVGYGVSQVPTNGMLGGMAYQDPINVTVGNISASAYDNGLWTSEKTFNVQFPSGTSNQKVQIYWPTGSRLQGGYEVTIATGYEYASASGMLRKTFGIHAAENGGLYVQRTTVPFALGNISSWFTISDIQWDSTNSRWYLIIANLAGTTTGSSGNSGNTVSITVKSHTVAYNNSVWLNARASAASISSIYSTDTTVHPILSAPITDNNGNFIIGAATSTGTASQPLQVTGGAYVSGSLGLGVVSPLGKLSIFTTSNNTSTGYNGQNFGIIIGTDNGDNLYDEGNGIAFTQQYAADGVDSGQVRVGAIVGYKGQATGNFGGGLKFKVQPSGATPMVDAMVLTKDGNLGIGAAIPGSKLQIVGDIKFGKQDYSYQAIQKVATLNADGVSGVYPPASFRFYTYPGAINTTTLKLGIRGQDDTNGETSDIITIVSTSASSGSVGIGTINPFAKTHIEINAAAGAGSGSAAALWLRNSNQTSNNSATIFAGNNSSLASAAINFIHNDYTTNAGAISFDTRTNASTYAERMRIDSSGRVTKPYQPSANWQISCNTSTFVRTLSLKRDANNNLSSVAAGNGSSHGSVGRFTAPIAGVYLITIRGTGTTISGSNELLSVYGSWSTGVNVLNPSNEVLDLRCSPLTEDGIGWSCTLYLSANDYWELDWYRPSPTYYVGSTFWDISTVLLG